MNSGILAPTPRMVQAERPSKRGKKYYLSHILDTSLRVGPKAVARAPSGNPGWADEKTHRSCRPGDHLDDLNDGGRAALARAAPPTVVRRLGHAGGYARGDRGHARRHHLRHECRDRRGLSRLRAERPAPSRFWRLGPTAAPRRPAYMWIAGAGSSSPARAPDGSSSTTLGADCWRHVRRRKARS